MVDRQMTEKGCGKIPQQEERFTHDVMVYRQTADKVDDSRCGKSPPTTAKGFAVVVHHGKPRRSTSTTTS
jgi:hypothetical protein